MNSMSQEQMKNIHLKQILRKTQGLFLDQSAVSPL